MTFRSGKNHKQKSPFFYLLLVGFFIILLFFWITFKSYMYSFLEPVVMGYSSTKESLSKVSLFFETYTSSRMSLVSKNKELSLYIEQIENDLAQKNAEIKELGGIISETGELEKKVSAIVAYPVASDITRIYSTVLLSKGYKDGVEKDMYAYVKGLKPVCVIKEVYTSTSLCELLSKNSILTEGVIEAKNGSSTAISLNLVGRGGGTFLADVIRDTPISVGDTVFLKSDQSMTLGSVVDVIHNNQDTSWRVFVKGAYNRDTSVIFYIYKK